MVAHTIRLVSFAVALMATVALLTFGSTAASEASVGAQPGPPDCRVVWTPSPLIEVNGEKLAPLMLFVNTGMDPETTMGNIRDEILMAKKAGVRFVSCNFTFPWGYDGTRDFSAMDTWLDFILDINPDAFILPRIWLGPDQPWWAQDSPDELASFGDGKASPYLSMGSELWRANMLESLEAGIKHIESHPRFASRIIGYHLSYGGTGEWFHFDFRERGNDISTANKDSFWKWLGAKYGSQDALAAAWKVASITRAELTIPQEISARVRTAFMSPDTKDAQYIDFQEYCSWISSERLIEASRLVKRLTGSKRLVLAFYGYLFELTQGNSGHNALGTILAEPSIDMLASPVSYFERGVGGTAPFMAPVDSVATNRKLWMVEDDTRTHLADSTDSDASFNDKLGTVAQAQGAHMRNLGAALAHRTGLWWMDLWSKGWLNDSKLWDNIAGIRAAYEGYVHVAESPRPDVAIVVDDKSFVYTAHGSTVNRLLLYDQRSPLYRAGLSYGIYLLDDVASGRVQGPKLFIFLNAHRLTAKQRDGLESIKRSGNTLAWVYGADFIGEPAAGKVTGFELVAAPKGTRAVVEVGPAASGPWKSLAGRTLGKDVKGATAYAASVPKASASPGMYTLGTYPKTALAALATRDMGEWKSVFYGSWSLDEGLIRAMAAYAGVHVYMTGDDVLQTDGTFFSVYATSSGLKRLSLPEAATLRDAVSGETLAAGTDQYEFQLAKGDCRWFLAESGL